MPNLASIFLAHHIVPMEPPVLPFSLTITLYLRNPIAVLNRTLRAACCAMLTSKSGVISFPSVKGERSIYQNSRREERLGSPITSLPCRRQLQPQSSRSRTSSSSESENSVRFQATTRTVTEASAVNFEPTLAETEVCHNSRLFAWTRGGTFEHELASISRLSGLHFMQYPHRAEIIAPL